MTRRRLAVWPLLLAALALLNACGGKKTPQIILVTATPTPEPVVLIVTATPTPEPVVQIGTATPSPEPPAPIITATPWSSPTVTTSVSNLGVIVLPLMWHSSTMSP